MKKIGYLFIAFGLAFLVFAFYSFFQNKNRFHSPVPEEKGVKVIFITPNK